MGVVDTKLGEKIGVNRDLRTMRVIAGLNYRMDSIKKVSVQLTERAGKRVVDLMVSYTGQDTLFS